MWAWRDKDMGWTAYVDGDGERGGSHLFASPSFARFLLSLSLFVRAAAPGVSCHGHGVLILHGHELSCVGLGWLGWLGPLDIPPRCSTKHLQISNEEEDITR